MGLEGGCLCGAIRYECNAPPILSYLCHCSECQRSSAGPYTVCTAVPSDALVVTQGQVTRYECPGGSGRMVAREFCARCGTQLFSFSARRQGMRVIRSGTLDDRSGTAPALHIWTQSALDWALPEDGARREPRGLPD